MPNYGLKLVGNNRNIVPFIASGDLSGYDADQNYPLNVNIFLQHPGSSSSSSWTFPKSRLDLQSTKRCVTNPRFNDVQTDVWSY